MPLWRSIGAIALIGFFLLGCGGPRPKGESCHATSASFVGIAPFGAAPTARTLLQRRTVVQPDSSILEVDRRNESFIRDLLDSIDHGTGPYHVLALSAGGQWGAYGAGVLAGLNDARATPEFSLVTGISTGAMLAPLMFLGEYAKARELYTNLTNADVFRMRATLELLRANSLVDTAPLRAKIATIITADFVERLARENAEKHRVLAVQSVDLDAGSSVVFDLTAIATGTDHPCGQTVSPAECIMDAVMAAAAIPVAFPPEFINGDMYVDGGLRQHAFSLKLMQATLRRPATLRSHLLQGAGNMLIRPDATPEATTRPIDLTLIANTDFVVAPQCVHNGILTIAERSAGVAIDQLSIGSFYRVMSETLEQPDDTARFTFADPGLTECTPPPSTSSSGVIDAFDKSYMRCLWKAGCTLAAAGASIWHTTPDDLPQSPSVNLKLQPAAIARRALPQPPAICEVASQ
jgi:hypothetical protein